MSSSEKRKHKVLALSANAEIIKKRDKVKNLLIWIKSKVLKLVVCILLRVLGQVQGFCLTQHSFEYFIQ
jgi:hypothetical protein